MRRHKEKFQLKTIRIENDRKPFAKKKTSQRKKIARLESYYHSPFFAIVNSYRVYVHQSTNEIGARKAKPKRNGRAREKNYTTKWKNKK